MICQEIFLKYNEATFSIAKTSSSGAHAGRPSLCKTFYDQVRSDFLKQSARYYRQLHQQTVYKQCRQQKAVLTVILREALTMFFTNLDKLSNRTFAAIKWTLTALSGLLTTGLIVILEI